MRLIVFLLGLLGAIVAGLQGFLARFYLEHFEPSAALEAPPWTVEGAMFALLVAAGLGLVTSLLVLIGRRRPIAWGTILLLAGLAPLGFDDQAWGALPIALAGALALVVRPRHADEAAEVELDEDAPTEPEARPT